MTSSTITDPKVSPRSAERLALLGQHSGSYCRLAIRNMEPELGSEALLVELLDRPEFQSGKLRRAIIKRLGCPQTEQGIAALAAALKSQDPREAALAIEGLARSGTAESRGLLADYAKQASHPLRLRALAFLASPGKELPAPDWVDSLKLMLKAPSVRQNRLAIKALGLIHSQGAYDALALYVIDSAKPEALREQALEHLRGTSSKHVLHLFSAFLGSTDRLDDPLRERCFDLQPKVVTSHFARVLAADMNRLLKRQMELPEGHADSELDKKCLARFKTLCEISDRVDCLHVVQSLYNLVSASAGFPLLHELHSFEESLKLRYMRGQKQENSARLLLFPQITDRAIAALKACPGRLGTEALLKIVDNCLSPRGQGEVSTRRRFDAAVEMESWKKNLLQSALEALSERSPMQASEPLRQEISELMLEPAQAWLAGSSHIDTHVISYGLVHNWSANAERWLVGSLLTEPGRKAILGTGLLKVVHPELQEGIMVRHPSNRVKLIRMIPEMRSTLSKKQTIEYLKRLLPLIGPVQNSEEEQAMRDVVALRPRFLIVRVGEYSVHRLDADMRQMIRDSLDRRSRGTRKEIVRWEKPSRIVWEEC